jgi:hypothetical protein
MQFVVGPGFILLATAFKDVRTICVVVFGLAVLLSWVLFSSGYPAGVSDATFAALIEGHDPRTQSRIDEAVFYGNFIGLPGIVAAALWGVRAFGVARQPQTGVSEPPAPEN